jgi:membrane-bound lytic murein transglycosylase D
MGRRLFRRQALAVIVVLAAASSTARATDAVTPLAAPPAIEEAGPLPVLQGIEAEELYSLPFPDEDIIGRYVTGLLSGRRDWLQAVLDRSRSYRALIESALRGRGLPLELAFLPAVESGFQPTAVSPRGATGLWQLMSNTAQPYGLRMDVWIDERRDPWRATEASIAKLADNEAIFGDWDLALAAYNCGVGKLSGILKRYPGSDYWTLRRKGVLPKETAAFVPQFLALTRILSHPGRYGLSLGWDPPPSWELVPLNRCVDLRILARVAQVPLDALTRGNPGLNFLVTPPASYGYLLKVPAQYVTAVNEALQDATLPLLEFRVHVVADGDTLSGMAKRYGVSVAMIQEFNPTVKERALRIGSKILVPLVPSGSK